MIKAYADHYPSVPASAFVSQTALVMGDVNLGEHCGVWPGAVIRGDFATITISNGTIIEDNVVVHSGQPLTIGENVVIGHGAVVHCKSIGNNSLIANNSTVLDDAVIGAYCIIGAGAVVSPGMVIEDESLVFGVPGQVVGKVKEHQLKRLQRGNASYIPMFEQYRKDGI